MEKKRGGSDGSDTRWQLFEDLPEYEDENEAQVVALQTAKKTPCFTFGSR